MATQQQDIARAPAVTDATTAGCTLVERFYDILVVSPQLLYKFYEDPGIISCRPSLSDQILSLATSPDHPRFKVEIETVDSQDSHGNGVVVLVCGSIKFLDNAERSFTHSFFLAPGRNGYFVVNEIFRYVDEEPHQPARHFPPINVNLIEQYAAQADSGSEPVVISEIESQGQIGVVEQPTTMAAEVHIPRTEVATGSAGQFQEVSANEEVHSQGQPAATHETPAVSQGAPESSQGLIVKKDAETQTDAVTSTVSPMEDESTAERSGCSIFISNLHPDTIPTQVEEEFKKFGEIKPSGVQVRTMKHGRAGFAFVEYEEAASVRAAIQASPMPFGARKVFISRKRPTAGRRGYRNDGPRRRGGYSRGGQVYGRSNRARGI